MARTFTLLNLRDLAKQYSDMENGTFLSDGDWDVHLSSSYAWLYDLLISSGLAYFETTASISSVAGQIPYALPSDYYGTVRVEYQIDTNHFERLQPLDAREVPDYDIGSAGSRAFRFRIVGTNILLYPAPAASQTYRHVYIPVPDKLTVDGDTIDGVSGWEELVAIDAAIKALSKEETDTAQLERRLAKEVARIEEMRVNRMIHETRRISDASDDFDTIHDPADWVYRRWG